MAGEEDPLAVALVLRTGGCYRWKHVYRLHEQLRAHLRGDWRLKVLSDGNNCLHDLGDYVPLTEDWTGFFSKIELFKHDFGRTLYLDLDVVVKGPLDWVHEIRPDGEIWGLEDWWNRGRLNSSMMVWRGQHPELVDGFTRAREKDYRSWPVRYSDQAWIDERAKDLRFIQSRFPGEVGSYKAHGPDAPRSLLVFHGTPKPWDCGY